MHARRTYVDGRCLINKNYIFFTFLIFFLS